MIHKQFQKLIVNQGMGKEKALLMLFIASKETWLKISRP